jgi:class 3 adenylate cyclase
MGICMAELPTGTVTLVFTDIEGSTRLLHTLGPRYRDALESHRALLREAFSSHAGTEVDTQGDAFFYAFPTPQGALHAALQAQRALKNHSWPQGGELCVRMGTKVASPYRSSDCRRRSFPRRRVRCHATPTMSSTI